MEAELKSYPNELAATIYSPLFLITAGLIPSVPPWKGRTNWTCDGRGPVAPVRSTLALNEPFHPIEALPVKSSI